MRNVTQNQKSIDGRKITNLRYADDTAVLYENTEGEMKEFLERIQYKSRLKINRPKHRLTLIGGAQKFPIVFNLIVDLKQKEEII